MKMELLMKIGKECVLLLIDKSKNNLWFSGYKTRIILYSVYSTFTTQQGIDPSARKMHFRSPSVALHPRQHAF